MLKSKSIFTKNLITFLSLSAILASSLFPQALATVTALDNFNRANGSPGSNWTVTGNIGLASNAIKVTVGNSDAYSFWNAAAFANDQYSQATILTTTTQDNHAVAIRMAATAKTFYFCDAGASHYIGKFINGTQTTLKTVSVSINPSDVLRCEVSGGTISYKVNGATIDSVTDSGITSGSPGLFLSTSDGSFDDFSGGDLSVGPPDTTAPSAPSGLTAAAISSSQINLSWTASSDNVGVTGYSIYRGGAQVGTAASTSYNDTGLTSATNYTYSVDAFDAAGNHSSQSTSANATTQSPPLPDTTTPTVPTNFSATAVSSSAINLSWIASTDNVGVIGYKIYRSGVQIGTSATNSYSDSVLTASTNYSYTVSAYDAAGNNSSQSTNASATTQAAPPPGTYPWSGIIDSSRAVDWAQAGVVGGIPSANWTQCGQAIAAGAAAATIQSAINACGTNQYVKLGSGTFNLSAGLVMKSNVVLRGSGADQTFLVFTGDNSCAGGYSVICFLGGDSSDWGGGPNTQPGASQAASWTAGYSKGSTQIMLSGIGSNGIHIGQYLYLDQDNDTAPNNGFFQCEETTTNCSVEGGKGNPGRIVGGVARQQLQIVKVVGCSPSCSNGSTFTISPGLYAPNWSASKTPGAYWSRTMIENAGLENLSVDQTNSGGQTGISMFNAANVWVSGTRQVRSCQCSRSIISMSQSTHITVQDNYIYGTSGHSTNYGVESYGASDGLVINNIFHHVVSPMMIHSNAGSVYAYNYAINDSYDDGRLPIYHWMAAMLGGHSGGVMYNLFEGNIGPGIGGDYIHGNQVANTAFRNYLLGSDPGRIDNNNAIRIDAWNRYWNIVGNILGTPGFTLSYTGGNKDIYDLGSGYGSVPDDQFVAASLLRWGNYDTVNAAVRWQTSEVPSGIGAFANAIPSSQNLPGSFYSFTKPSWWPASKPWPPIGPDVSGGNITGLSGHAYTIPAEDCFRNVMGGPVDGSGSVLSFNASICYASTGGGGGTPTPLPGDFNLDHVVNSLDFSLLNTNWFKSTNISTYDLVTDNLINSLDFAVLKSNWGKTW